MAERVQRQPTGCREFGAFDGVAEVFADFAVVKATAERVAEDECGGGLVGGGEPGFAQEPGDRGGEDDAAF